MKNMTFLKNKISISLVAIFVMVVLFSGAGTSSAQTTNQVSPSCNSVTLTGDVTPNGNPTDVWFEWGTSQFLGSRTPNQNFSSPSNFSAFVSGLTESTTYYYRAMAQNSA